MWREFVRKYLGVTSFNGSTTSSTAGSPEESGTPPLIEGKATLSPLGQKWLKDIEKLRLLPYDDQTGKQINSWCKGATIGYGHLIAKRDWSQYQYGIDAQDAEELFLSDLAPFEAVVREIPRRLEANKFDACVILAFNIGVEGFRGSTVRKMVENPNYKSSVYRNLETAWKAWNKSQGEVSKGLVNRRAAEWDMYAYNIYRHWW